MTMRLRNLGCLLLVLLTIPGVAAAQYCNPAVVSYLVRDQQGAVLTETELQAVFERLPKAIGDARVNTRQVSFMNDSETYYWPESSDWSKGSKWPALEFANAETCTMRLEEVTLTWQGQQMHLVFNLGIDRSQHARRIVIDSLPFQEGSFRLDLNGWSGDPDKLIPATRWKRIKSKPDEKWRSDPLLNRKSGMFAAATNLRKAFQRRASRRPT